MFGLAKIAGLAKVAEDGSIYYEQDPELDRLRDEENKADAQYNKDNEAYKAGLKPAMRKGGWIGAGASVIPSGALMALADSEYRIPMGLTSLAVGGAAGGLIGRRIAEEHFNNTSPLAKQRNKSLEKAENAQTAHINRWLENDEKNMYGLAKKADVDIAGLIANGVKRIPQMDDLANLAIVANGKQRQAQAQGQIQNGDQQNPPKPKNI